MTQALCVNHVLLDPNIIFRIPIHLIKRGSENTIKKFAILYGF